jgi:ssDNA-binding replication factor A large subunit
MPRIPKEIIIQKIKEKAGLSDKEISSKIKDKMDLLSGLISEEGAAYIIANELGVKVYDEPGNLQIKNIMTDMRSVDISGRVIKIYETRSWEKENRKGKVGSFLVGDDTGVMRVTCWNDKADLLLGLKENQTIKIEKAYTKENNGRIELHLGDKGNITVTGEAAPQASGEFRQRTPSIRKSIKDLQGGEDNVEILGTIVQAFDPKFFEVCPECGKRVKNSEEGFVCPQHNTVTPTYGYVMNLMLDDGSENIRVVLWRNQVQKLLNMSDVEIVSKRGTAFEEQKTDLLGKIMKFVGRAQKNEMFNRIEFTANLVFTNPDPEEEMQRLQKELDTVKEEKPQSEFREYSEESVSDADDTDEEAEEEEEVKEIVEKINLKDTKKKKDDDVLEEIDDLSDLDNL